MQKIRAEYFLFVSLFTWINRELRNDSFEFGIWLLFMYFAKKFFDIQVVISNNS
jgi:hypothetical protein